MNFMMHVGGSAMKHSTGSTGVAALRAGKRFVGIERNPQHFETAVRRISDEWAQIQQVAA